MSEVHAPDPDWTVAATVTWLHEAQLLRSVLEAAGIEVRIPDEHTLGVQPFYSNALGGASVMVPRTDLARATDVLRAGTPSADR